MDADPICLLEALQRKPLVVAQALEVLRSLLGNLEQIVRDVGNGH